MKLNLDEFQVRAKLFSDLINDNLDQGKTFMAYGMTLALLSELEEVSTFIRSDILAPLSHGVRQQSLCVVNQAAIRQKKKGKNKSA